MAKLKFVKPGSKIEKIGTKKVLRQQLLRNLLISFWIIQTLCTAGYIYYTLSI